MIVEIELVPEKAQEIRETITHEFEEPSEGYWDGVANVDGDVYSYTTGTSKGYYHLTSDDVMSFEGLRNSFLDGNMLFEIGEQDAVSWEIKESKQPRRSPWSIGILNLTQHNITSEQFQEGVDELMPFAKEKLQRLLTFNELKIPTKEEVGKRAGEIAEIAKYAGFPKAMIGGAPFLMSVLEKALKKAEIEPVYAFSKRVSEEHEENGKVVKTQVFKHLGFVEVSDV